MAKKRKAAPKEDEPKLEPKLVEPPSVESEEEEEEEEEEDEDDGFEEEEEEEEEEKEKEASSEDDESEEEAESDESEEEEEEEDDGLKRETIRKLLQPFGKDQLIDILKEAATTNPSIIVDIIAAAESDPVQRKIFVHGLGWDTTKETLNSAFKQYGQIEECNVVTDKLTGRSKGYGFVLFEMRAGARKALKQPQKKIGNRMTACQLASAGPVANHPVPDASGRRLYIANVGPQISAEKLQGFFAKFGEIEEGPLGYDKLTGKFRGFAIIVYKRAEGIKKVLEEPVKMFEGCKLHCSRAVEGRTPKTNPAGPVVGGSGVGAGVGATVAPSNLALPTYPVGLNQGLVGQNFTPAAVLVGQNPALGILSPVFGVGPSFAGGVSQSVNRGATTPPVGLSPGFGAQPGINTISPSVIGSYGSQAALQGLGAYQSSQLGQSSASAAAAAARSHSGIGSVGSFPSYFGR